MAQKDIPPQLIVPQALYPVVRNGTLGIVFRLSKGLCAKILFKGDIFRDTLNYKLREDDRAIEELDHECDVNIQLYKRGISVPEPIGVERIKLYENESYPALIMEYLPFPSGSDLGYHEFGKAERLAVEELGKASDVGFNPGQDCRNPNNFLYDRNNQKIYLIDFGRWSFDIDYKHLYDDGDEE